MISAGAFPRKRPPPRKRPLRTPGPCRTSSDLADGLVAVAESFLAGKVAGADDAEIYQVVVHAGTDVAHRACGSGRRFRGNAGRPGPGPRRPGRPGPLPRRGRPGDQRVHRADDRLHRGAVLDDPRRRRRGPGPGRRRRRPSSAIRRAARERDHCRCRFPGCESRRADLHHIQHWASGGRTDLDNLISLCPWHHKVVHDRGYLIAAPPGGRVRLLPPGRQPAARQPAAARARRRHRHRPRRGHHPGHDHPALVRRAPRPEPRHLGLLRQRQDQGRTRAGPRRPAPGPRHDLRTRRLRRTLPPVPRTRPPAYRPHPDPDTGLTNQVKAPMPVMARPTMSVCMVSVPTGALRRDAGRPSMPDARLPSGPPRRPAFEAGAASVPGPDHTAGWPRACGRADPASAGTSCRRPS